jgi:Ca-activated chloride channel family protein
MQKFFTFLFILWFSFSFSQQELIPQISVDQGIMELNQQFVEVNIVGTTADIRLYQSFSIRETESAYYLFPVNSEVSLYELTVYYPDQIFTLEAKNMDNIRKQVVAENKKGKKVSLIHSADPTFLRLDLPNVPKDDEIKVVVKYMRNLDKESDHKTLLLPSFVSKKYKKLPSEFGFNIDLISPTPIYDSELRTHNANFKKVSEKFQTYAYKGDKIDSSIDLQFNTKGDQASAGMLVYEDKGCRYILGVVEPPSFIKPEEVAPREYIFVMDVSGSMHGFPIETSKELMRRILNDLKPYEKFNILFFAGSNDFFAKQSVYATQENKDLAIHVINDQRGKGSTLLSEAMQQIYNYKPEAEFNRIVVLITDGMLTADSLMLSTLRSHLNDAQYFVFGIGYEVGRKTIQVLGNTMGTEPVVINEQATAEKELDRFYNLIRTPLLRHIIIQSKELNLRETYPSQFNGFLSNQSTSFVSKECSGMRNPKLIVSGINGDKRYSEEFSLPTQQSNEELFILKYLWAREKIDFLLQEEERCGQICVKSGKYRNEIIKIGEELNIATPYTSFIEESYINLDGKFGRKYSLYTDPNAALTFQNDFDSDFDGIPNTLDECPFDAGTVDRKGCPKTKEEKIAQEINRMLEGIEFDFDSYVIRPEFFEKLNTAADIINQNVQQKYIVEGHTDAAGTPEYNLELSMNRARSVVNYLKRKGVDGKRLKIVGKGDSELKHPECRPHEVCDDQKNFENRRVIFKQMD